MQGVYACHVAYHPVVPKLWTATIDAHRREVRDAVLDATAALVAERGLLSVTMSGVAEAAGIGRATLYKYFTDVEAILAAWHERQVSGHLAQLQAIRDQPGQPHQRLRAVLEAYAVITHESRHEHDGDIVASLHRDRHVADAERHLHEMVTRLLADAATAGEIRADMQPDELATFCLNALTAARRLPTKAAVQRLLAVTLGALDPT